MTKDKRWTNWINYRLRTEPLCFYFVLFSSLPRSFSLLNHLRKVRQRCSHSIFFFLGPKCCFVFRFFGCYGRERLPVFTQALDKRWARYQIQILNNLNLFCSILLKFLHDEAGLLRNGFYFCWCVVAIMRKWYIALKSFFSRDFCFQRVGSSWFCNARLLLTPMEKNQWPLKRI